LSCGNCPQAVGITAVCRSNISKKLLKLIEIASILNCSDNIEEI
jgi:hypothetical protein